MAIQNQTLRRLDSRLRRLDRREPYEAVSHAQPPLRILRIRLHVDSSKGKPMQTLECRDQPLGCRAEVEILDEQGGASRGAAVYGPWLDRSDILVFLYGWTLGFRLRGAGQSLGSTVHVSVASDLRPEETYRRPLQIHDGVPETLVCERLESFGSFHGVLEFDHGHRPSRWEEQPDDLAVHAEHGRQIVRARAVRYILDEKRGVAPRR